MGNPLTDMDFVRLLDDRLITVYHDEYDGLPMVIDDLFTRIKDPRAWLEYYSVGSVPDPEEFHGVTQYQSVSPGFWTKITPTEWAGGIIVQRRLLDTDRYDVIESRTKGLARAANRKMNKIAHEPIVYCDSTAFNFMSNEEGVALCSNSHTSKSGLLTTGNDNYSTLSFDAVNLEAARVQSLGFRDDIGERIVTNFDTIIYGSNLEEAVWEVVKSEGKVDEMTNNRNFQRGRWKTLYLPLIDDYDTDLWGIADSRMLKESLKWVDSVPLEFNSTTDTDTHMRKYADYFVVGWGWTEWRGILMCKPA